jgi:hypothetical protein
MGRLARRARRRRRSITPEALPPSPVQRVGGFLARKDGDVDPATPHRVNKAGRIATQEPPFSGQAPVPVQKIAVAYTGDTRMAQVPFS